jgi:formamidopyrimidine-DNA glycosylase
MPELPEVELYTRYFAEHALHRRIARVRVLDDRILGAQRRATFTRALTGKSFTRVRRHGKHFFAAAGAQWLHLHFGMSGDLSFYRDEQPRFARVVFDFADATHLAFEDMRLFGVAELTPDPDAYVRERGLGPDPLDPQFRLSDFRERIAGRRGAAKALLMSQEVLAGIGNLYADETLFQTAIHPRRPADRITPAETKAIFTTMRKILRTVIERKARGGSYPSRYLTPHREAGERCPRCGGTIEKTVVMTRTTYFCARHQR